MNLRIAKKVLNDPDRYSHRQRYEAAHRLYRFSATFRNGEICLMALMLKPQKSFREDEQLDLRFEVLTTQVLRGEQPKFIPGEVLVPQENINKPVYRSDGQAHNFNALPYPNTFYKHGKDTGIDKGWWEMGEWRYDRPYSRKKYQIRTGGKMAGVKPKRLKRKDFGLSEFKI